MPAEDHSQYPAANAAYGSSQFVKDREYMVIDRQGEGILLKFALARHLDIVLEGHSMSKTELLPLYSRADISKGIPENAFHRCHIADLSQAQSSDRRV